MVKAVSWFGSHNPLDLLFGGPKIQQQSFDGSTAGLLHKISGGDLGGSGIGAAFAIDRAILLINQGALANGNGVGGNGFQTAAYDPDDDAGSGGGLTGGSGGLHGGGGYTVLSSHPGGASSIMRMRGHWSGGGGSVAYSGGSAGMDQRGQQLMGYLVGRGWSPAAAAIAAGNAQQESSLNPNVPAGDGGISHGIFQWNHERYAALLAYSAAHGLDLHSLAAQEGFFATEAEAKIPGWKSVGDLSKAGLISHAYEGYGDNSTGTRIANSKHFLGLWQAHRNASAAVADSYPESDFSHHAHSVHAAALNVLDSGEGQSTTHVTNLNVDGKRMATVVQKHFVNANRQVFGAGGHDRLGNLAPVDSGFQFER